MQMRFFIYRKTFFYKLALYFFFTFIISSNAMAQTSEEFDEMTITLSVQRIGTFEIPGVIKGQTVYLGIKEVFDFLKIRNIVSSNMDSISGSFINAKALYLIDYTKNVIQFNETKTELGKNGLIKTATNLYLKSDFFGSVFGLDCVFNFRSLSVTLYSKVELPVVKEMQLELMRRNISQLKGEKKADTIIARKFSALNIGTFDWSVISTQDKGYPSNSRINLGVGGILLGGETSMFFNYNVDQPINLREQFFNWRIVNNEHPSLKQISVGSIFSTSVALLRNPVIGAQVTNTPTTYRRSYGSYRLSDKTEPNWLVELYVNNVLVNYIRADASGFFSFEVPLVYGNSNVRLRFYSAWGEEQTKEQNISIPFNFVPLKKLEYRVISGIVSDEIQSRFARANFNYGLSSHMTIGGGYEYLSSVTSGPSIPFINTSLRIGSKLLVSGEYAAGVRTLAVVSYRLPSTAQFDFNYVTYVKGQTAIPFTYVDEKKIIFTAPFHSKKSSTFTRVTLNQITLPTNTINSAEVLLSYMKKNVSTNFTTFALFNSPAEPYIYSNLSLTFRLAKGIRVIPQAQYEYNLKDFSLLKLEFEKKVFNNGFLNLVYENFATSNNEYYTLAFRYNFSFTQTSFTVRTSKLTQTTSQMARGSMIYDDKFGNLVLSNQNNLGRGGFVISPFLDLNWNGKKDPGEPKAMGLKVNINGGRIVQNLKDTTNQVYGLEAYTNYFMDLTRSDFDNVAWQIKKPTLNVVVEPNHFKLIEIPVVVFGEIGGMVYTKTENGLKGQSRIIINIYDSTGKQVARTISETDGYINYIGLQPGNYYAMPDEVQMLKLGYTSTPRIEFKIKRSRDGDIFDAIKFTLTK